MPVSTLIIIRWLKKPLLVFSFISWNYYTTKVSTDNHIFRSWFFRHYYHVIGTYTRYPSWNIGRRPDFSFPVVSNCYSFLRCLPTVSGAVSFGLPPFPLPRGFCVRACFVMQFDDFRLVSYPPSASFPNFFFIWKLVCSLPE